MALVAFAVWRRSHQLILAARGTADPFLTLAGIVLAAALADRAGLFRLLARLLVAERASPYGAAAAVLAFTALLSALVNLDVAVVVAMPVALRASGTRGGLAGRWLAAAVAVTANATSFLLPTSNITTLLVLGRAPLSTGTYVAESWLPWLLVTAPGPRTMSLRKRSPAARRRWTSASLQEGQSTGRSARTTDSGAQSAESNSRQEAR